MSTTKTHTHFSRIPGGRYAASQHADTTWDVFDVPVFSVVPKGVKGAPKDIGEDDLRAAVNLHGRLFNDDRFLPRLNTLHNYGVHKATPGGFFLPKSVRPFRMKGQTVPVIFADLLAVPDEIFRAMEQDKLPYCSVEIRQWEPLQFGALALLDTEPPFFEFPLITIGTKQEQLAPEDYDMTRFTSTNRGPAVAAFVASAGSRFLFRFGDDEMPDEEKKKDEEKDEAQMADGEGAGDLAAAVKAIEEQMKALEPLIALKDKIAALVESPGEEVPSEEEIKGEGPVEMSADGEKTTQMAARISALEDYRSQVERERKRDDAFSSAVTTLEGEGYNLTESSRRRLFAAAEMGGKALEMFTSIYREHARKDPPAELDGLEPDEDEWPSEVMQFAAAGPEKFTEAKRVYREWSDLKKSKHFRNTVSPLEKYLSREMRVEV